ncbi:MAG: tetratricopeptide repeat protein [Candidatus Marithrix sp.]
MKNKLFIIFLTGILFVISNNVYAKRSWLEKGISITSDVLQGMNAIGEMAERNKKEKVQERIVYKDRIIYRDNEELSEEHIRIKKELANTKRLLAWEKAKDGNHKKAVQLYEESLEHEANDWRVWHGYGWSFLKLYRYKEAGIAFMIAIEKGGKGESWRYLGLTYAKQDYHEKAIRCYTESLDINPSSTETLDNLRWSQQKLNKSSSKCVDGRLSSEQIKELVSNKVAVGKKLLKNGSDSYSWREAQERGGYATFKKKGGNVSEGRWKIGYNELCWCYGECNEYKCKYVEARNNCSVWYYIDTETGNKTGRIHKWIDAN